MSNNKKNESYKKENYHKKEYPLYLDYNEIENDKFFLVLLKEFLMI